MIFSAFADPWIISNVNKSDVIQDFNVFKTQFLYLVGADIESYKV